MFHIHNLSNQQFQKSSTRTQSLPVYPEPALVLHVDGEVDGSTEPGDTGCSTYHPILVHDRPGLISPAV